MYTLALTTFMRYEMLLESFSQVIDDPRVSEIVIVDDDSPDLDIKRRLRLLAKLNHKIRVYFQAYNRGMSRNKADAISYASNEWVIILDSDNVITPAYLDAIPLNRSFDTIYCPDFAAPHFDYRKFSGKTFDVKEASKIILKDDLFNMLLNTCNYLVHRDTYIKVYNEDKNIDAADTIHFALEWLKYGGEFYICPGMSYWHRVHDGSGFLKNAKKNMADSSSIRNKIANLYGNM